MSYYPPTGGGQEPEPRYPYSQPSGAYQNDPFAGHSQHAAYDPQPQWGGPPHGTPPRRPKSYNWWYAVPVALALVVGIGIVAGVLSSGSPSGSPSSSAPPETSQPETSQPESTHIATRPQPSSISRPSYRAPTPTDLKIDLKVLSKECFGEAGCIITCRPNLTLLMSADEIDPSATFEITYEITGGQNGAITETLDLTGGNFDSKTEIVDTPSSSATLQVKITQVEEI